MQQSLRGAPRQHPAEPAGVARADDDDAGLLLLRDRLESMRGRGVRYQRPQLEVADIIEPGGEPGERAFGVVAQERFVCLGAGAKRL